MATNILNQVRQAISNLNPNEIQASSRRPLKIAVFAPSDEAYQRIELFLCPEFLTEKRYRECAEAIWRVEKLGPGFDLCIYDAAAGAQPGFAFDSRNPQGMVREILDRREDIALPLARVFYPFRKPFIDRIIAKIARENALFSLATAIPNIAPLVSLPWAVAEFTSDTTFLTINQVRMAFVIAAASDRGAGFGEQKNEVASIIAGAFGWRTLAREAIGKIPAGGGLIPKAAIAYAATYVIGLSLERLYRAGAGYTRRERKRAYDDALSRGKEIVSTILGTTRRQNS